ALSTAEGVFSLRAGRMRSSRRFAKETAGTNQFEPVRPGKAGGVVTTAEISCSSCNVVGMPLADFVHLRVHTAYSLSAGAIRIKELVELCKAERMPAVAVTDSGNLFGALEVATTCPAAGIHPILGCEIALVRNGAQEGSRAGRNGFETDRIVLLAQNETGYRNLLDLVSRSYLAGELPTEP